MASKKYISLSRLSTFLDNLKNTFALLGHKHTVSDISDYTVDASLSPDSNNPVANKVIDAEFEAVATAMNALESAMVGKNVTGEIFTIDGTEVTASEYAEIFNNYAENIATGKYSHAEGYQTIAKGSYSHVEGYGTLASGAAAHAEGYNTKATARYSHAEGANTTASGNNSHAEGDSTVSSGHYSHAEGNHTTAAGGYSHAEGNYTNVGENGTYAHAEGSYSTATATGAHAEGNHTEAAAVFAHTEGLYTKAASIYQHVRGKYNIVDDNNVYSTIIGNGDSEESRANIHTLDWSGNAWFSGDVYVGSTSGTNKDDGSKKLATEDFIIAQIENMVLITADDIDTICGATIQMSSEISF